MAKNQRTFGWIQNPSDKYFNDLLYPDVQDVTMLLGIIHAIVLNL